MERGRKRNYSKTEEELPAAVGGGRSEFLTEVGSTSESKLIRFEIARGERGTRKKGAWRTGDASSRKGRKRGEASREALT